jgi:hypothetical protein
VKNESPSGEPVGKSSAEPDNGTNRKADQQSAAQRVIRYHSHPLNPANRGDVKTPSAQPDQRPVFSAYGKTKPIEKSSK